MKVLLLGATGLIGQHCLKALLNEPRVEEVVAPTRRNLSIKNQKLYNALVDFERLDEYPELFNVDAIICCLGTTIKQAGSRANFRRVDYQYCADAADLGRAHNARSFLLVSALGASEGAPVFYSRVKGQLEAHLKDLQYTNLSIYRPSLLLGNRDQSRWGESIAAKVMPLVKPLLIGKMSDYRAIPGRWVAMAMVYECLQLANRTEQSARVNVYTYDDIARMAASTPIADEVRQNS